MLSECTHSPTLPGAFSLPKPLLLVSQDGEPLVKGMFEPAKLWPANERWARARSCDNGELVSDAPNHAPQGTCVRVQTLHEHAHLYLCPITDFVYPNGLELIIREHRLQVKEDWGNGRGRDENVNVKQTLAHALLNVYSKE